MRKWNTVCTMVERSCVSYTVFYSESMKLSIRTIYKMFTSVECWEVCKQLREKKCIWSNRQYHSAVSPKPDSNLNVLSTSFLGPSTTEDLGQEGNVWLSFVLDGFALLLCLLEVLLGYAFVLEPFQVDLFFCRTLFVVPCLLLYNLSLLLLLL